MTLDRDLVDLVAEAMAPLGAVSHRRMMGGAALYLDGVIFALVTGDGALWFKADAASDAAWDAAGCERFHYARAGRTASIDYRRAPEEVHDDAEAMRAWAMLGVAAGRRAAG
ncbi:TfoX/Sxy family protein [Sphingomonas sp. RHCKR7]|uniref:TfoX/Sxy family protein n=1 Tax=Sphingomonas folli TaxID=2862497 RepID=UPI001C66FE1E|nr:TfoX/Sxy family protein [Sphingomonas folli]MBW6527926.1 TfoX/Sxy family protein [Sphingomonas folli]